MKIAVGIALIFLSGCSSIFNSECGEILQPPVGFTHKPTVPFTIHPENFWEIDNICRKLGARHDGRIWGCSYRVRIVGVWNVYVPVVGTGDIYEKEFQCILKHEYGHINTGRVDHEGWEFR